MNAAETTAVEPRADMREAFQTATGMQLSDAGEAMLRRFGEAAGIRNNDALWTILYGFEMYRNLYADIPAQVAEATSLTIREQSDALKSYGERAQEAMRLALAEKAGAMQQKLIADLTQELRAGAARKVIEEQAREAISGPVKDAAGKLERLASEAQGALERYRDAHTGIGPWLSLFAVGLISGLAASVATLFLR